MGLFTSTLSPGTILRHHRIREIERERGFYLAGKVCLMLGCTWVAQVTVRPAGSTPPRCCLQRCVPVHGRRVPGERCMILWAQSLWQSWAPSQSCVGRSPVDHVMNSHIKTTCSDCDEPFHLWSKDNVLKDTYVLWVNRLTRVVREWISLHIALFSYLYS